jgi:hypothetical protein
MAISETVENIFRLIGGRKMLVMTGSKAVVIDDNTLAFSVPRNNLIHIKYNESQDLFEMNFYKRNGDIKKSITDLYADQLVEVFESETGLYTKL